ADAQLVAGQHFEADTAAFHELAGLGHAAEPFADQAAHRRGFDVFSAVESLDEIGDAIEIEAAGDNETALAIFGNVAIGFVLVADFADDDFEQVFHGGESGGIAILIDHDDHVGVFLLHAAHEHAHRLGFGHEHDVADEAADSALFALLFLE